MTATSSKDARTCSEAEFVIPQSEDVEKRWVE